jgi:transposase
LAQGRLQRKGAALRQALRGRVTDHHRFSSPLVLDQGGHPEQLLARLTRRIEGQLAPWAQAVERLTTIPGVERRTAPNVLAEIGTDLRPFPTAAHRASWAGVCPGNQASAGRRRRGRTGHGNRRLRQALVQAAGAAGHTKNTYPASHYRRLAARRGRQRAPVALAHARLVIIYGLLGHETPYRDLGADYGDRWHADRLTRYLVNRLETLGHQVRLEPPQEAA